MSGQVESRSPTRLAATHSKPAVVASAGHVDSHAVTKRLQVSACCIPPRGIPVPVSPERHLLQALLHACALPGSAVPTVSVSAHQLEKQRALPAELGVVPEERAHSQAAQLPSTVGEGRNIIAVRGQGWGCLQRHAGRGHVADRAQSNVLSRPRPEPTALLLSLMLQSMPTSLAANEAYTRITEA